jgi:acyl-CoA thioesterase
VLVLTGTLLEVAGVQERDVEAIAAEPVVASGDRARAGGASFLAPGEALRSVGLELGLVRTGLYFATRRVAAS